MNVPPVTSETVDIFQWFLGMAIVVVGFFLHRALYTMDRNNEKQWKAIAAISTRLSTLEGAHSAIHEKFSSPVRSSDCVIERYDREN